MSPSEHKRVFRRLIEEGFNGGCLAILDELLTPDFADHSPCQPRGGVDGFRERIALLRLAIPDLRVLVDNLAADDDMTWAALTIHGTGRLVRGVPEGECLGFSRIDTCRYVNGRIAEYWSETADLLAQLGITVT
jgi:predicted ester cyclase